MQGANYSCIATLLEVGRKLFLLCDVILLRPAGVCISTSKPLALQFCDQGGASSATLLHAGRKLFLHCDIVGCRAQTILALRHICVATCRTHIKYAFRPLSREQRLISTRSATSLKVLIHATFAELSAHHASFPALGSECHKPFLHVANTMIALQFCDQGGASSATLLHAGRKLFLLCDIYVLRPAERKSSMHFDL